MIERIIEEGRLRRERDARRFAELDWDRCMLCGAEGEDKRTLTVDCFYAVEEVLPEAIDLHAVEEPTYRGRGYLVRVCKSCRGSFLGHLATWRRERIARRDIPKDHDGNDAIDDPDRNIPVRVNGAVVMMSEEEYREHRPSACDLAEIAGDSRVIP